MKVAILCKSDSTGGAAIVSFRLMEALRSQGVDARLLVMEKQTDSPFVVEVGRSLRAKYAFLAERLDIFLKTRFDRSTLFQIDTGRLGMPLWNHPLIREADAVMLNWVNQGMLSLRGMEKVAAGGKPIIWTMHDMWNFTGICHHAFSCRHFLRECGDCFLLKQKAAPGDLSRKVWRRKNKAYASADIAFVGISDWLMKLASKSSLLKYRRLQFIPNPFPTHLCDLPERREYTGKKKVIFGAARLDNPIKGLDILIDSMNLIADSRPDIAAGIELLLYGDIRDASLLERLRVRFCHVGAVNGFDSLQKLYRQCDVVVSTSHFETTGTTLVEGQAFGCVPVAFDRGGQGDIISHLETGYLVEWDDDKTSRARRVADGILWALEQGEQTRRNMRESVEEKYSYKSVAAQYIALIDSFLRNRN